MLNQASKVSGLGLVAIMCGLLAVPACDSGGDDDDNNKGGSSNNGGANTNAGNTNGGNTNAGNTNAGNTNAGNTNAGTGGSTGQMVAVCPGVVPPAPAVTDFETVADPLKYEWGSTEQGTMDFWGGTFNYPVALALSFEDGAMTASGSIKEFAGFGLYVQNCANASSYDGVRFKIKGTPPGTEKVRFAVQTNKNEWATGVKGSCLAPSPQMFTACVHPSVAIDTITEADFTTVEVMWADLAMGKPAADATTDGSDVIGLQWILPWADKHATYEASITIDDIEFIGEGGGMGGAGTGGGGNEPAAGAGGAN